MVLNFLNGIFFPSECYWEKMKDLYVFTGFILFSTGFGVLISFYVVNFM